jgi:hypothetical protein
MLRTCLVLLATLAFCQLVHAQVQPPCTLPTTALANPQWPIGPGNCTLPANAIRLADDGATIEVLDSASPVFFMYCWASACNAPFMFITAPIQVGLSAMLGGAPTTGPRETGTLYLIPGAREVTLRINGGAPATYLWATN